MSNKNYSSSSSSSSAGVGFVGLLTTVFVVLKILGYVSWSWFWVLSPIWITIILVVVLLVLAAVIASRS